MHQLKQDAEDFLGEEITSAVITVAAMIRFATTTWRARRDRSMTLGSVASSSRTMTASEVSSARSEPWRPIASPRLAAASAGGVVDAVADQQHGASG